MPWKRLMTSFLLCLLLTGCGASPKEQAQKALDFRTALMEAGGCGFTAQVTADYGDYVYQFTMDCEADREQTKLHVTAPEELAGIGLTVEENGKKIQFDDMELDFGELGHGLVPPVTAPWLLTQCWVGEYIAFTGADDDLSRVTYLRGYDDEELTVDTWFDSQNVPVYAEVALDDVRCLTIRMTDFHF